MKKHLNLKIYGRVQGVFFRAFASDNAQKLGITGFARNERDGTVYIEAEGSEEKLKSFLELLEEGSRAAKVSKIEKTEGDIKNYKDFNIEY